MKFVEWLKMREAAGLADADVKDPGKPLKPKKRIIKNRYEIPDVPTFSFERDRGVATKLDPGY